MTPNPQAVAENDTVEKAIQIMRSLGERSVPVVDKNRHLKGVVGMKDVVDLFARPKVREQYGEHAGREEKILLEVQSVMRYPPLTVGPDADAHRARFTTAHRVYHAHHFDWDLHAALKGLLETLGKRIQKEKERRMAERKRVRST